MKVQTQYQRLICAHLSLIVGIPRNTTYIIHHNIHIHPFQHFNLYQIHNPSWHSFPSLTLVSRSDKQSNPTNVKFIIHDNIRIHLFQQFNLYQIHNPSWHLYPSLTLVSRKDKQSYQTYIKFIIHLNICIHPFHQPL